MNNLPRLWRSELDAILQAEASTRSPADRRKAFSDIAFSMRRNTKLVAALRTEGRHLLDARAAVLQTVEVLAIRFPDLEAEEAFLSAIATALTWCLDLEARAKAGDTGDTPKKNGVANSKNPENATFLAFLARKKKRPEELEPVAREWYLKLQRESGLKVEENGKLKPHIRRKIKALARAARRAYEKGTLK